MICLVCVAYYAAVFPFIGMPCTARLGCLLSLVPITLASNDLTDCSLFLVCLIYIHCSRYRIALSDAKDWPINRSVYLLPLTATHTHARVRSFSLLIVFFLTVAPHFQRFSKLSTPADPHSYTARSRSPRPRPPFTRSHAQLGLSYQCRRFATLWLWCGPPWT